MNTLYAKCSCYTSVPLKEWEKGGRGGDQDIISICFLEIQFPLQLKSIAFLECVFIIGLCFGYSVYVLTFIFMYVLLIYIVRYIDVYSEYVHSEYD